MIDLESVPVDTTVGSVMDPVEGRLLDGRYRLDRAIARGGMATVYEATDLRLDRTVAVKVMRPALAEDPDFVDRFAREARAAARLSSPEVVAVHDQGTDADTGTAYLVMEHVAGCTLRDVLRERGPLPADRALDLLEPVLRALAAAHAAGLVHRDVKPENVLLGDDGRVKVADFGLARAIESSNLTATTGLLIGTVAYLAPEQVEHGRADPRTDVYAAGILLFELLTGVPPYSSDSPLSVAYRHVHEDVPAPSRLVAGLPAELDDLVVRTTRRDPAARPVDAGAFLAELQAVRQELAGPGRVPTLVVPRSPRPALPGAPPPPASDSPGRLARLAAWRPSRPRLLPLVLVLLLLVALGAVGGVAALTTTAPDVVGLTRDDALRQLQAAGFTVKQRPSQFSTVQPAQHIISQDPPAGGRLRRGGTVTLVNSKGPPMRTVPALVGLSQDAAAGQLTKAGLRLGTVRQQFSSRPAGEVLSSDPAAGATLTPGSPVVLVVSKGLELLPVPDVVGQPRSAAEKALSNAGFPTDVTLVFSDSVEQGTVIAQNPAGGDAARGTTIALQVSKGPDTVKVPSVGGNSTDDAVRKMRAAGLATKVQRVLGGGPGRVLRTDPGGGSTVKRGSTVTLYVF